MAEGITWNGDQADGLRRLFGNRGTQVVAFASGREACGRTTLVVQTAMTLAAAGHGVVIVDENPGPENAIGAFGLTSRHDLLQVVNGERSLTQALLQAAPLVRILPAARAVREWDKVHAATARKIEKWLKEAQQGAGFVLIDCANRRGQLSPMAVTAPHLAIIVAAQGTAITEAYALIKRLVREQGRETFQIVITRARSTEEAKAVFDNMQRVTRDHLGIRLDYLGTVPVPVSGHLAHALLHQLPMTHDTGEDFFPASISLEHQDGMLKSVV